VISSWIDPALPKDASLHGHLVDELLWVTDRYDVFVVVVLLGLLIFACLRFHRRRVPSSDRGTSRRTMWRIIGLSLLGFGVVDGYLFGATWRDLDHALWNVDEADAKADVVRVEVNAQQWSWAFRYPGPDGQFNTADDAVTLDDLRVPLGRPVVLELAATDVVHSFSLPNFRIKQDAVPGQINRMWFQAKVPGRYEIVCQQLCGVSHYKMRGLLTVLAPDDYRRWLTAVSEHAERGFDQADEGAHWGWDWRAGK
jgi:cytochrome c oxidase subunit 2